MRFQPHSGQPFNQVLHLFAHLFRVRLQSLPGLDVGLAVVIITLNFRTAAL